MRISTRVCVTVLLALAFGAPVAMTNAQDADWQKVLAAAKKEGVLNSASSSFSGKAAVAAMKEIKDKYSFSVEFIPGRIEVIVGKILVEQQSKSYVTDCMDTHSQHTLTLKSAGHLVSVAGGLPALKDKSKFTMPVAEDKEAQLLNILNLNTNVWINTNLVKPGDEPKSYHDLLDPKWKGKIFLSNPLYGSGADQVMVAFTKAKKLDEDYFVKLYKNGIIQGAGGGGEMIDALARGEYPIAAFVQGTTGLKPFQQGAPIKPLDLKEGYMVKPVKWVALKNAPHPNANRVFINWLLSKEGQTMVTKEIGLDPVRNDVPSPSPFSFKGPRLDLTFEELLLADQHGSSGYMAKMVGAKK